MIEKHKIDFEAKGHGLGLGYRFREPDLILGADTEVIKGVPYTFQGVGNKGQKDLIYLHGNPKIARNYFYDLLDGLPDRGLGIVGFYFFKYDVQVLFLDHPEFFTGLACLEEGDFIEDGYQWTGVLTWPTVFVILRKGNKKILLFDLFRFFEGGLKKVCLDLKLPINKRDMPAFLKAQRQPTPDEVEDFERYALTDSAAALQIAEIVVGFWREHEISPCLSGAHMAYKIFKKKYTVGPEGKPIGLDQPDILMLEAGMRAYHGGRNSLCIPTQPYVAEDVKVFDINSMYPHVGANCLDGFFRGYWTWESPVREFRPNGIYNISGIIRRGTCWPYMLLMDHGGEYLDLGPWDRLQFGPTWFTGIEILTAIKYGMLEVIQPKKTQGFYWRKVHSDYKPLREFFLFNYEKKAEHKGTHPVLYEFHKKQMNTLYGKLASTIPHERRNEKGEKTGEIYLTPGAAFNSPIAALFTGHSRCIIFEAEVKHGSIQSATDSIYLPGVVGPETSTDLGGWTMEQQGQIVIGRNKLYAILSQAVTKDDYTGFEITEEGKKVWYWEGRKLLKYALHAFQGTPIDFLNAALKGITTYSFERMGNLRESRRNPAIIPLAFNKLEATVDWGGKYGPQADL